MFLLDAADRVIVFTPKFYCAGNQILRVVHLEHWKFFTGQVSTYSNLVCQWSDYAANRILLSYVMFFDVKVILACFLKWRFFIQVCAEHT